MANDLLIGFMAKEGKALREELEKGSERQKEAPDSTCMSACSLHEIRIK
jgi:hypothetical protein